MQLNKRQRAIVDFAWWVDCNLPVIRSNVDALMQTDARGMQNSVLRFVVPLAMNQAIEHSVLRVMEAWLLLDAEMLHLHLGTLDRKNPNYLNLKRVRDKLVAHRAESAVYTTEHAEWYRQEIGSYSKAFDVVDALAKEIALKVRALQESGVLSLPNLPLREVPSFYRSDVEEILEAMRVAGIF